MANDDMKHLDHIASVLKGDENVLRQKESTYMGSWKRAGGRSAWFMFRRNMDRLIQMMAPTATQNEVLQEFQDHIHCADESGGETKITGEILRALRREFVAEDIFAKILESPNGSDGTVLACLRDLRRYATLVEAEMVARGVVVVEGYTPEATPEAEPVNYKEIFLSYLAGHFGTNEEVAEKWWNYYKGIPAYPANDDACPAKDNPESRPLRPLGHVPGDEDPTKSHTPEDGGHHESTAPWYIHKTLLEQWKAKSETEMPITKTIDGLTPFYAKCGQEFYKLTPIVVSSYMSRRLQSAYTLVRSPGHEMWVLRMESVPEHIREDFPRLQREMNLTEFNQSPVTYRFMYEHLVGEQKYVLRETYAAWGRDS